MRRLVLASASPRRQALLKLIGIPFEVRPSGLQEDVLDDSVAPDAYVRAAAMLKAEEVARGEDGALVLGADTVVYAAERILGKPRDLAEAAAMLRLLSGRTHQVLTGVALLEVVDGRIVRGLEDHVETDVRFRRLSQDTIAAYLDTGEPMDKAGAYAIQERGALLVEGIVGCFYNVVGLPVARVAEMLEEFGLRAM